MLDLDTDNRGIWVFFVSLLLANLWLGILLYRVFLHA